MGTPLLEAIGELFAAVQKIKAEVASIGDVSPELAENLDYEIAELEVSLDNIEQIESKLSLLIGG